MTINNRFKKHGYLLFVFFISLLIPAISILLHEVGHYLFGFFYGFTKSKIYYSATFYNPVSIDITPTMNGVLAFGGTLLSILQVIVSIFIIQFWRNSPFFIGMALWSQTQVLRNIPDLTRSEEYRFGQVLPIPNIIPWIISLLIFIAAIIYILIILKKRKGLIMLTSIIPGLIFGFYFWMTKVGPGILPFPK